MPGNYILTVTALNRYVKSLLDSDVNLRSVYLKGEISNFKVNAGSGHFYMTLKDESSRIRAAMFRGANSSLKFVPEDGMSVVVKGRVSLYEQGGEYQLIIDDMQPDGAGALAVAFEQLKKKLGEKGYFDEARKKPIPAFPKRVGIITSGTGAAIRDLINVISRRCPVTEIVFKPVAVQGERAATEISEAIKLFNDKKAADVLIVGRGGGSIEDLWAFNEEPVINAVYESGIPVISAVGHETDFTICDFTADLRAPTPSAAAELAVPDMDAVMNRIYSLCSGIGSSVRSKAEYEKMRLSSLSSRLAKSGPSAAVDSYILRTDAAYDALSSSFRNLYNIMQSELAALTVKLDASNPAKTLARGFSVVIKDNRTVSDASQLKTGDMLTVRMSKGSVKCEVKEEWKRN